MEPPLDRTKRNLQGLSCLVIGEPAEVAQDHNRAKVDGKLIESFLEQSIRLVLLKIVEGGAGKVDEVLRASVHFVATGRIQREDVRSPPSQLHQGLIDGDTVQPSIESALPLESPDRINRLEKRFLENVFSVLLALDQFEGKPVDLVYAWRSQLPKSLAISLLGLLEEIEFCFHFANYHVSTQFSTGVR